MTLQLQPGNDPLIPLIDLARQPNVTRTALELAIRSGKLIPIARHGKIWVSRVEANVWLSWRTSMSGPSAPTKQFEL